MDRGSCYAGGLEKNVWKRQSILFLIRTCRKRFRCTGSPGNNKKRNVVGKQRIIINNNIEDSHGEENIAKTCKLLFLFGGRYWNRTSDFLLVREAALDLMNYPDPRVEVSEWITQPHLFFTNKEELRDESFNTPTQASRNSMIKKNYLQKRLCRNNNDKRR